MSGYPRQTIGWTDATSMYLNKKILPNELVVSYEGKIYLYQIATNIRRKQKIYHILLAHYVDSLQKTSHIIYDLNRNEIPIIFYLSVSEKRRSAYCDFGIKFKH